MPIMQNSCLRQQFLIISFFICQITKNKTEKKWIEIFGEY